MVEWLEQQTQESRVGGLITTTDDVTRCQPRFHPQVMGT